MAHESGTISGYAQLANGTAIDRLVYITPSVEVYDVDGNLAIDDKAFAVQPDPTTGFWQTPQLPASDDLTLDPSGVTYKVSVRGFASVSGVPVYTDQDTEYATIAPRTDAPVYATYGVSRVAGLAGDVDAEDLADALEPFLDVAGGVTVQDEGTPLTSGATTLNFVGSGVTATGAGSTKTITISSGGISGVTVQDEGTPLATAGTTLNFTGAGVTASGTGATKTITISGGGGGGGAPLGETVNTVAASGSAVTLPAPATATINEITLTANCAITVPTWTDDGLEYSILVSPRQRNTGGSYDYTVSWVGDIDWSEGGDEPLMPTGSDAFMDVTLRSSDGGASWKGSASVPNPGTQGYTLTIDGSGNVAIPADRGDVFDLLLTQDAHLSAPTGLYRNKMLMLRVIQDATGGHELTYDPIFRFSSVRGEPFLSVTGNKADYLIGIYNTLASKIDMLPAETGF